MAALTAPDVIEKVAQCLLDSHSVWYSPKAGPWYDREGILQDAANLMRAASGEESSAAGLVAGHLFKFLSPHLSTDTASLKTVQDMKTLLKSWGLATGGNKGDLLARIREQTEVAKVPVMAEDGVATLVTPRHSKVSAATYAELNKPARGAARISASKCRDIFLLTGSLRAELLPSGCVEQSSSGNMYLLSEAKAAALAYPSNMGSWAVLSQRNKESYFFIPEAMAATKARKEEILGVLVARGWQAVDAAEILGSDKWGGPVTWGDKDTLAIDAAADFLELARFCSHGLARELFEQEYVPRSLDPEHCRVRASLSDYKKDLARGEWAARQAVAAWAREQPSMEAITNDWRVPRSLLPVLERAHA